MSTDIQPAEITPGERRELRSVVRSQYRVLREEIDTRVAELFAEADARLREKYAAEDKQWADLKRDIDKVIAAAQKRVDALIEKSDVTPETSYHHRRTPHLNLESFYKPDNSGRSKLEQQFREAIRARSKSARLQLDRQEADTLRALAADAIQSEKARAFLEGIPSVVEILPSKQLAEVEAAFSAGSGGSR